MVLGALGASWGDLGASWGVLGASWGRSGGVLEAPWGVLKGKRWPTWLQLGSQNGAKIHQKSKPKSINFLMPLGIGFLKDVGGFWKQNGAKLAPKWHQKSIPTSNGDFLKNHRFPFGKTMVLKDLGGRSWHQKSIENQPKKELNLGRPLGIHFSCILVDLGGQDGAMLAQKSIKNRSQEASKKQMQKSSPLGALLGRSGPPLGPTWVTAPARRYEGGDTLPGLIGYVIFQYSHVAKGLTRLEASTPARPPY